MISLESVKSSASPTLVSDNSPPVAVDDEFTLRNGAVSIVDLVRNDYDPEGGSVRVASVNFFPSEILPDGRVLFDLSDEDIPFSGYYSFVYTIVDDDGATAIGRGPGAGQILIEARPDYSFQPYDLQPLVNLENPTGQEATSLEVSALQDGNFVVGWVSEDESGVSEGLARIVAVDGTPISANIPLAQIGMSISAVKVASYGNGFAALVAEVEPGTSTSPHPIVKFFEPSGELGGTLELPYATNEELLQPTALVSLDNSGLAALYIVSEALSGGASRTVARVIELAPGGSTIVSQNEVELPDISPIADSEIDAVEIPGGIAFATTIQASGGGNSAVLYQRLPFIGAAPSAETIANAQNPSLAKTGDEQTPAALAYLTIEDGDSVNQSAGAVLRQIGSDGGLSAQTAMLFSRVGAIREIEIEGLPEGGFIASAFADTSSEQSDSVTGVSVSAVFAGNGEQVSETEVLEGGASLLTEQIVHDIAVNDDRVALFGGQNMTVRDGVLSTGDDISVQSLSISTASDNAPVAVDDEIEANEGGIVFFNPLRNDLDPDVDAGSDSLSVISVSDVPGLELLPTGFIKVTLAEGELQSFAFEYTISDDAGQLSTGTVAINISELPRFSAALEPVGDVTQLNETEWDFSSDVRVEPLGDGFIQVWRSQQYSPEPQTAVFGRILDRSGNPVGSEIMLSPAGGNYRSPSVTAMGEDGSFAVAYLDITGGNVDTPTVIGISGFTAEGDLIYSREVVPTVDFGVTLNDPILVELSDGSLAVVIVGANDESRPIEVIRVSSDGSTSS
ncbi:Ig-like domain-containing protein, partial [Pacificimonas aurantium]